MVQTKKRTPRSDESPSAAPTAPRKRADRWFRAVADYTYDWESWHAPDGRVVWVNPAVERVTGHSVAECLEMPDYPLSLVVEEDRGQVAQVFQAARQRESGENVEFRCRHRSGAVRWMSVAWQPMYGGGRYLGFRTSVRDVSERHRLREELRRYTEHLEQLVQERTSRLRQLQERQRQMEKLAALGQLAAGVAHEINNPLAGMRNAFELIKGGLAPDHEHFGLLELIDREIDRISGIVHQMYQLYRRSPQEPGEFPLHRIAGEVVYLLEHLARNRQVTLRCIPPDEPLQVVLAEGEVKQILFNLVRNAIEASPTGQEVTIRFESKGDEAVVHVEDHGPGITEPVLAQIFDPFFSTKQGDWQTGMGLGLSVSRSLIEAMGGRIEVATRAGKGTTFSAYFPLRLETHQEPEHE